MTDKPAPPHAHPYYIATPDYRDSSAGIRVMHRLCHMLNSRGCEAYVVGAEILHPELTTPRLDRATADRHRRDGLAPIAVYPEIITGNPLDAPVCVRYMLNKEGVVEGNSINPGPDDLFFYYSRAFTPNTHGRFDYLRFNTHDLDLFRPDPEREKRGPLLYLNRIPPTAVDFAALPPDIEILSNQTPLSLPELAGKLQAATVLYAYEKSATCTLAMLCGCPVVALTLVGYESLGFSEQSLSIYGGRGYALSDSEDAIQAARESLPAFRQALANLEHTFPRELEAFVAKTQARADAVARAQASAANATPEHPNTKDHETARPDAVPPAPGPLPPVDVVVIGSEPEPGALTRDSIRAQSRPADAVHHLFTGTAPMLHERLRAICAPHDGIPADRWTLLLDDGDRLRPDAVAALTRLGSRHGAARWLHTDASVANADGSARRLYPPDASPRLLRSGFALPGALAVRTELLCRVLQYAAGLSAENWRQALPYMLLQAAGDGAFVHVAEPWVTHPREPGGHPDLLLAPSDTETYRSAPDETPLVSILIPTRDQLPALQRCVETVFEQTREVHFEIIIVGHETHAPEARQFLAGLPAAAPGRLHVLEAGGPFNFSLLINLAARRARGRFLLLLNDDTAALHPEWLPRLLEEFADPEVGVVAPRLVFPDGRIQNAAAVLGLGGAADFPWVGVAMDEPGHLGLLAHAREVSAVSGSAMMIRRDLFESLGGMDEHYAIAFGDFDLCLRARQRGFRCIWTPGATLLHEAGRTLKAVFATPEAGAEAGNAFQAARARFLRTWLPRLGRDPHYNLNLSLTSKHYEPERNAALHPFPALSPDGPRVLALPADDAGSGQYRVRMPAHAALRQGLAATRVAPGYPIPVQFARLEIDTLFSQRQVDDNHLQALSELRDLLPGLRVVMDFDDLLTELPRHSHHRQQVWPDIARRLAQVCKLSDCITASTQPLAERLRKWHENVRIIPNGIDPAQWAGLSAPPARSGKLRVGWAGGLSHAGDLAIIRKVVAELADQVEWVFLGMCLEDMQPHLAEFHYGVAFDTYPAKLASLELDLAIAPLESNTFNECKSNLRLLEYGALGIPVIATDITPYRCGLPVTLVGNRPQAWIAAIGERLGEREALRREGARLREAVFAEWTLDAQLPHWVAAWGDL